MKSFKSYLVEMATPSQHHKNVVYYHGTSTEAKAKSIFTHGLDPSETIVKYGSRNSQMKPEEGSVYITPQLQYAMIYALGGDFFGHNPNQNDIKRDGEFGYVFEISGNELVNIGPDEDAVGELIYRAMDKSLKPNENVAANIVLKYVKHLTDNQFKKIKDGQYSYFASGGKKINKFLSDSDKLLIIDSGSHISHKGKLKISKCWRFSRLDTKEIKKDGSNFFDYAKEWKP